MYVRAYVRTYVSVYILSYVFSFSDKDMKGECQDVGDSAAQWFSKYLGIECRLYYMSPSHKPRYFTDHSRYGSLGKPDEEVIMYIANR